MAFARVDWLPTARSSRPRPTAWGTAPLLGALVSEAGASSQAATGYVRPQSAGVLALVTAALAVRLSARRHRSRCHQPGCGSSRSRPARADGVLWVPAAEKVPQPMKQALQLPLLTGGDLLELRMGRQVQKQERDGHLGWGFVVQDVCAPPSVVLGCLKSFEDYPSMIPVVRRAEVLSRTNLGKGVTAARCSYRVSKFMLGITAEHIVDVPTGFVRFDLDPSNRGPVLKEASGYWYVEQSPDGPPSSSRVWLHVGLHASHLLPHALIDYAAERALRRATRWLRPHVEGLWQEQQRQLVPSSLMMAPVLRLNTA